MMKSTPYSPLQLAIERANGPQPVTTTSNTKLYIGLCVGAAALFLFYQCIIIPKVKSKTREQLLADFPAIDGLAAADYLEKAKHEAALKRINAIKQKTDAIADKIQTPELKQQEKLKNEVVNASLPPNAKPTEGNK